MNEGDRIDFELDGVIFTAKIIKILGFNPYKFEIEVTQYREQE